MTVDCGVEIFKIAVESVLRGGSPHTDATLVLDVPWGHALQRVPLLPRPLLVVTETCSSPYLRDLVDLDPEGILIRPATLDEVRLALERVKRGERLYMGPPPEVVPLLKGATITPRERQMLRLVALGLGNLEVARRFGVSERTVANGVSNLRDKLGLRSRVEVALYYLGVLSTPSAPVKNSRIRHEELS